MMDPATVGVSMAEMDYKGAFSMGKTVDLNVKGTPGLLLAFVVSLYF